MFAGGWKLFEIRERRHENAKQLSENGTRMAVKISTAASEHRTCALADRLFRISSDGSAAAAGEGEKRAAADAAS